MFNVISSPKVAWFHIALCYFQCMVTVVCYTYICFCILSMAYQVPGGEDLTRLLSVYLMSYILRIDFVQTLPPPSPPPPFLSQRNWLHVYTGEFVCGETGSHSLHYS